MFQQGREPPRHGRLSLSIRVSIGLVLAAIIPLLITVLFSELQTRPTLINQANREMQSDAKTRVQLIDAYFKERMLDAQTLVQIPSLQLFLVTPPPPLTSEATYKDVAEHATFALLAGKLRDVNYTTWTIFDPHGKLLLTDSPNIQPAPHGQYMVPPEDLQRIRAGQTFISAVYYSPATQKASVDIYAPIIALTAPHQYLGFARANLRLDYIWGIVQDDLGNNGTGSYAFILDQNGVRIADPHAANLFKSVTQLAPDVQGRVQQEARYGNNSNPVPVLPDHALTNTLHHPSLTLFQAQPVGQHEVFQIIRHTTSTVPWSYFVLSPVNTVTAVANQQLLATALIAFIVSLVVALLGLFFGQGIVHPILRAVESLRISSTALSLLATQQRDHASAQMGFVDSSQVGLPSVQYYTDATEFAAQQLGKIITTLRSRWNHIDAQQLERALGYIAMTVQYIEKASQYQSASNQKLASALKVATQVTEQLVDGTTSATDAAIQMERIVQQLRHVAGK